MFTHHTKVCYYLARGTTANIYAHLDYKSKITSAQAMETGLALPEGGDFESRWGSIDVGENG